MNTNDEPQVIDLATLSDDELAAEMKRRGDKKLKDKEQFKLLSNQVTPEIFAKLKAYSEYTAVLKAEVYQDLKGLIELKFEAFGIKSDQQTHTFTSETGETITIGYNVIRGYDDTAMLGVAKVKEFINSLATDAKTAKLIDQILRLLKPTKSGDLDPRRVMELRQMAQDYSNPDFIEGVQIIQDAYNPKRSSWFITAASRNNAGIDESLPLSIAAAPFPKDFDLTFLIKE